MPDALEDALAERLGSIGATVGDDLPLPADLELRVRRRRGRARAARRAAVSAAAAAVVAAVATVAVVHGAGRRDGVRVAASQPSAPTTVSPAADALQPGTVMLSARGRYVISLDATGHTNATMVESAHEVTYARATADHRHIWYLSLVNGAKGCGAVVRADLLGGKSTIVTHAVAFDVSPDGSRVALYGAGDLAHGDCSVPDGRKAHGRIVVLDVSSGLASAPLTFDDVASMSWSPDGSSLVVSACTRDACDGYATVRLPDAPDGTLRVDPGRLNGVPPALLRGARVAFGTGDLYAIEQTTPFGAGAAKAKPTTRVVRIAVDGGPPSAVLFSTGDDWEVRQVVPTASTIYVIAAPRAAAGGDAAPRWGLYRIEAGRLGLVRALSDPGVFSAVSPFDPTR